MVRRASVEEFYVRSRAHAATLDAAARAFASHGQSVDEVAASLHVSP